LPWDSRDLVPVAAVRRENVIFRICSLPWTKNSRIIKTECQIYYLKLHWRNITGKGRNPFSLRNHIRRTMSTFGPWRHIIKFILIFSQKIGWWPLNHVYLCQKIRFRLSECEFWQGSRNRKMTPNSGGQNRRCAPREVCGHNTENRGGTKKRPGCVWTWISCLVSNKNRVRTPKPERKKRVGWMPVDWSRKWRGMPSIDVGRLLQRRPKREDERRRDCHKSRIWIDRCRWCFER
jgi:hypothetical protein